MSLVSVLAVSKKEIALGGRRVIPTAPPAWREIAVSSWMIIPRMKTYKIKFGKADTVHIPFMAEIGSYDQLHAQIQKVDYPKSARRIEATITCSVDLKEGTTSYEMAQVSVMR